ncbi:amidohydrolase family protein [Rhizobium halophytocola]|uniref:2-amino-3-carboxymuconate-6-semialdehyde decarboxylase n=1 Tax=Rhizobium halophytocola TaxID=735519 RepID=A0ABS4DUA1_9HYPH|nr:amidohydrolase family protein [Rhizobium halophytocola]MBP1849281.1 aminocarboxymuconate-semialdehyde decarboxylase [Rhizobium halophytocola]
MTRLSAPNRHMFGRGCACCGIDVHTHVVPADLPAYLSGPLPTAWPSMVAADACHRTFVVNGRNYRTLRDACWLPERRLEDMADMQIGVQVLSPMPELFSYWMDAAPAAELLRYTNDVIAELIEANSRRFVGLGAVPLQDIDLALTELHRLMKIPGFAGIEIGSNINGGAIGDPRFLPFFQEAQRLGSAVFVHAVRPTGMERLVGPAQLQQVLAYPTDVGLAAVSCITSNLLLKLPDLRIAFSHGGGTLASLLPRLREGWKVFSTLADTIEMDPYKQVRKLYLDSLVYDEPTLRHLLEIVGEDRILAGTDYPFNFHERAPLTRIDAAFADQGLRDKLAFVNAAKFLDLTEPH